MVTDGGSLAAHASLVAREYGIPAVVATADATAHLADGQVVTVDGGASGTVHPTTDRRRPHIGQVEHGKYWTGTGQLTSNINRHGCLKHHDLQGRQS
jgi:phosphoenolpyruvate-protein kinase (PTS system EI component)